VSKILGLIRDLIIANYFGTSMQADAFNLAYLFTGNFFIIFGCIGGPFYSAVIAVLPKLNLNQEGVWSFIKNILIKLAFAMVFVALGIYFLKPFFLNLFIDGSSRSEYYELTLLNIDLLLPLILICGPIGFISGVLNIYKKYYEPSLAPAVVNVFLIATVFLMGDSYNGIAMALGTSLGGVFSLVFQLPPFLNIKKTSSLKKSPQEKAYWDILYPVLLSTGMSQLVVFVDSFFCKELAEGSWTAVVMANRLIQMPLGVLLTALMVPLYPLIGEMIEQKDLAGIKTQTIKALKILMIFCIPSTIVAALWAEPMIRLVFQRGAFNAESTSLVASVFFWLSFSIIPYVLRDTATRLFYSFGDSKTPMLVMLGAIFFKVLLNYILVPKFEVVGIAISTLLVSILNFLVLLLIGFFIKLRI
jgi:putative peptidoglycan lipid II flippase